MKRLIIVFTISLLCIGYTSAQVSEREQTLLKKLEFLKDSVGEEYADYASVFEDLCRYYMSIGTYSKSLENFKKLLVILGNLYGKDTEAYAVTQGNMILLCVHMSKYDEAKALSRSMIDIYSRLDTVKSPKSYVINLVNAASTLAMVGDYESAEEIALESLTAVNRYHVSDSLSRSLPYEVLGLIYCGMGHYRKSEENYLKAVLVVPKYSSESGKVLNNIGILYYRMGLYEKAREWFEVAYEDKKRSFVATHPIHGSTLSNIGIMCHLHGDYKMAEKYFSAAASHQKNTLGEDNRQYINSVLNLGHLYQSMGDYARAISYLEKGTALLENNLGKKHSDYAAALNVLADVYFAKGAYAYTIDLAKKALEIHREVGEKHPESVASMIVLGKAYIMIGDYASAEGLLQEALDNAKHGLGETHNDYAEIMYLLGVLYDKKDDFSRSKEYYLQALDTYAKIYSTLHPKYVATMNSLGELYQKSHQYAQAKACFMAASQAGKQQFVASTDYMSERQRELFWETIRNRYEAIYPRFGYENIGKDPALAGFIYDNELFIKGLLLNSSTSIHNSILNSGDTALIRKWDELKQMNVQILALQENDPTSTYIDELQDESEKLEKQLIASSTIFRKNKNAWNVTWETVRAHLVPYQVAIEFFVTPTTDNKRVYSALLLRAGSKHPRIIKLCEEGELSALLQESPSDIYGNTPAGRRLYNLIWKPILKYVKRGEIISFSPAGKLHQLSLECLPYDTHSMVQDSYHLQRLSSTRELVTDHLATPLSNAVLYGGIQYNMDYESLVAASEVYQGLDFASRAVEGVMERYGAQYLPGSKKEVDCIHEVLTENKIQSHIYTSSNGNEESFKALDGKENHILHIATHGFFWSDQNARSSDYYMQRMLNPTQKNLLIDPLSRCGLLFAGANLSLLGHSDELPEGVQDGILTGKELSLLDLRETELIVLSACETGKGDITSEGVFGLQRALKMAGVQTIIMSLWKVNDQATQVLMTEFYTNWIDKKQSKREAFKNAQNTIRAQFESPEYWAGFVLLD